MLHQLHFFFHFHTRVLIAAGRVKETYVQNPKTTKTCLAFHKHSASVVMQVREIYPTIAVHFCVAKKIVNATNAKHSRTIPSGQGNKITANNDSEREVRWTENKT